MESVPLPGAGHAVVAVPAPGTGPGYWAGAPCVVHDGDTYVLGYRVRNGHDGIDQTVVARSDDGESFTTVAVLDQRRFGAQWMERPALVRLPDGGWRLFVCCGTPETKRWWVEAIDSRDLEGLVSAPARTVFPGDEHNAVKDPIVRRTADGWEAWLCCHPLDVPGAEDRMSSAYATSADGETWRWHGTVLQGRPGQWDARGARLTWVFDDGWATYDGRASAEENWFERTGVARLGADGRYVAVPDTPVIDVRYLTAISTPEGQTRLYYEARLPDESHELRTEVLPSS